MAMPAQGPNAQQVWDQSWWDAQGFVSPPLDPYQNPAPNVINFDPAQLASQKAYAENWRPPIQVNPGTPGGGGGGVGTPGGGVGGPMPTTPGVGGINTTITPRSVFSNQQTAQARNMAVNDAMRRASPVSAYKQFDRPGVSRSLATQQRAMPTVARAYTDAAQAKAGIPLADFIANEQNLFQGELARANEFQGLGRLLLGEQSLNNYSVQQLLNSLAPILGSLF